MPGAAKKQVRGALSPQKIAALGIESDLVGQYLASNYPELAKKGSSPASFSESVREWRLRIERDITDGKYLNKSYGTGGFRREHGYEPSPSEVAGLLDTHQKKQRRIQQGWVGYLKEGGYSDGISGLLLSAITKETAHKLNGKWEFRKLGGSSLRLPPEPDPELVATFAQRFNGDQRPSQLIAELGIDIARREAVKEAGGPSQTLQSGELTWMKIPSREKDPENFHANVLKLTEVSKTVEDFGSCKWCTAHGQAEGYLDKGDFWVGIDQTGRARCGIRLFRESIAEIRGVLHSQAVEPGLAGQLSNLVISEKLEGGDKWVEDARMKGRIAELGGGCSWEDIKAAVERTDDSEALNFIHSYRGPSGEYDALVGADNNAVQGVLWSKLAGREVTPLNLVARAGALSQARGWVDSSVIDAPRDSKYGGGTVLQSLFSDNAGMAGRAPHILKEWKLLTPERQLTTTDEGDNIWHLQAGRRVGAIRRAAGGPDKAGLKDFLEWPGLDEQALYAPNAVKLTPMHIFFEIEAKSLIENARWEDREQGLAEQVKKDIVDSYLRKGGKSELLDNNGGGWAYPIIFSAAKGGMLSSLVKEGVVTVSEVSGVRGPRGETPWHHAKLIDLQTLGKSQTISSEILELQDDAGVSVAETVCRQPGGFSAILEAGLLDQQSAAKSKGTRVSLGHLSAGVGDGEAVLKSGIFDRETLLKIAPDTGNNFLHHWAQGGLKISDPQELRALAAKTGLTPDDFLRPNKEGLSAAMLFAEKPGALLALAQAGLVDEKCLDSVGGPWKESVLHRLPPRSAEAVHFLSDNGLLKKRHLMREDDHGAIPLQRYLHDIGGLFPRESGRAVEEGDPCLSQITSLARRLGLTGGDFSAQYGVDQMDCFDVLRSAMRQSDGSFDDPLITLYKAGLVDRDTLFGQRHSNWTDGQAASRTESQLSLAKRAAGRSPFEDCVISISGGAKAFHDLCECGAVDKTVLALPHGSDSEWANHTDFVLRQAEESPEWKHNIVEAVERGLLNREALLAPRKGGQGPVLTRFNDMVDDEALLSCLRQRVLAPADLLLGGDPDTSPSVLARIVKTSPETLKTLVGEGFVEDGALSQISVPYGQDRGNPARHLLEFGGGESFCLAAKAGLLDKSEAIFGRGGFSGGPLDYAMRNGLLGQIGESGLLGKWMLDDTNSMREVWKGAAEHGCAAEFAREMKNSGVSVEKLRQSLLDLGGDGRSGLGSLSSRHASSAIVSLAEAGIIRREDLLTKEGSEILRSVFHSYPETVPPLARSGLIQQGDLYSGVFGSVSITSQLGRAEDETVMVDAVAESGILSKTDKVKWASDLCTRRGGSVALRRSVDRGVLSAEDFQFLATSGQCALDELHKTASRHPERQGDLAFMLERKMVPSTHHGKFARGAEGSFSTVNDAFERVSRSISQLLSQKTHGDAVVLRRGDSKARDSDLRTGCTATKGGGLG